MSDAESAADDLDFDALLAEAEDCLTNVEDCLGGVETLEDLENDTLEELLGDVETLMRVATETEELLDAIDLSDLPEAIDGDELLEAIEIGEIPDVLADDDAGATDLVDFTQLFRAINLLNAWDATDLGDLWQEKQELEDAIDDLGDGEDAGFVEDAVSDLADGSDDLLDEDLGAEAKEALGDIDIARDPEAYQVAIQQQAMEGIDAFRSALLETHERFEQLYEFNRERMRRQDTSTNSRNPTATSTVPVDRRDLGGGARYSTVPQQVKYSTAPTRKRIYGRRFEIEREKQRRRNQEEPR